MSRRCIAVLGGSFDPVHHGHIALATLVAEQLQPDELRLLPAGNPWQKAPLGAAATDRTAMLERAFGDFPVPVVIDQQEVCRPGPSYTIDTLQNLRLELGPAVSVVFIVGADQIERLHTWRQWRSLLDFAHLYAVSRPGFALEQLAMDPEVATLLHAHAGHAADFKQVPLGKFAWTNELAVDVSATSIRQRLAAGLPVNDLLPSAVLDYIQQHRLYRA